MIWKTIINFEGYEVSDTGLVRSIDRLIIHSNGHRQNRKGNMKVPEVDKDGYHRVRLYKNGKSKKFYIHRLVCIMFLDNKEDLPQVNHKNGIKTDNKLENLEWCDATYNNRHAVSSGLRDGTLSYRNPKCYMTKEQIIEIKESIDRGEKSAKIARRLDLPVHNVYNIKYGKTHKKVVL